MKTAGTASLRQARKSQFRWASLLVILMLIISPTMAMAAPSAQEIDPELVGTWESNVSENGETVTVALFDDGTISGTSTYEENDDQILYAGSWESTGEDTFVLYIESVDGEPVPEPIEFIGLVTRRGLRLPDAPDWGRNGMSLTLADEEPVDFAASEEEVVEEGEVGEEAGEDSFVGVYASDEIVDDEGGVTNIVITLFEDGSMETVSTYEGADGTDESFETGTWSDNGDGTLAITFQTIDGEPYDPEVALTFEVTEPGRLAAPDLVAFGEEGLVVVLTGDEVVATEEGTEEVTEEVAEEGTGTEIAGLYGTGPVDGGEGIINGVLVYLGDDGFAQSLVVAFSGADIPISRVGEWVDNGDGTVTIDLASELLFDSAVGTAEASELDAVESLTFELTDGALVNPELTLYPTGEPVATEAVAEEEGIGEEVIEEEATEAAAEEAAESMTAGSGESVVFISPMDVIMTGTSASLVLLEDGTASLAVTSSDLADTVVEVGTWESDDEAGTLQLILSLGGDGLPLEEPTTIDFTFDEATDTLVPGDYDTERYGPNLMVELVGE